MTNCVNQDCPNWGKIVIDANSIRFLLSGTIELERGNINARGWTPHLPIVQAELVTNLDLIKHCSCDNQMIVSEPIWSVELREGNLRESARPPDLSTPVYDLTQVRALRRTIQSIVSISTDVTPSDIQQLQQFFKTNGNQHLADRDASLFVLAIKLNQDEVPVRIVSSDPDFYDSWQILIEQGFCELSGVRYEAEGISVLHYASFITHIHKCCSCSSDKYKAFCNAWLLPIIERRIRSMKQQARTALIHQVNEVIRASQDSLEKKSRMINVAEA